MTISTDPTPPAGSPVATGMRAGNARRILDSGSGAVGKQVLEEFNESAAQLRRALPPALWPLLIAEAGSMYRWRVLLDCGCVTEVLTPGEDRLPQDRQWHDPVALASLPPGEVWCRTAHGTPSPYREVVEWLGMEIKEIPGDPEDDPYGLDPGVWAVIRRPEPHSWAFWRVRLVCGHYTDVATEVDWRPEDGPRLVSAERAAEMLRGFEEHWASAEARGQDDVIENEHLRMMLERRWPRPAPERRCHRCSSVGGIVGYQPIGWLVPRRTPVTAEARRSRVERQLRKAEAEVEELRRQLDGLG